MSWVGDLQRAGIQTDGNTVAIPTLNTAIGRGNTYYIDGTHGSATNSGRNSKQALLTLSAALGKVTNNNNDVIKLIAETTSVKQASALTWDENLTHLVGEGSLGVWNQRSRIEQNATAATWITVSGYGNSIQNIYFMQGAAAADVVGISITGQRNTFKNCHFLPQVATAMDDAAFRLISIDASEQTFLNCFIGGDGSIISNGALLQLGATSDGGPPRAYFENCIFFMKSDAAGVAFIDCALGGLGTGWGIFKNCQFLNLGTSLTYGILGAGLNNYKLFFDLDCTFAGVTDIVADAYIGSVYCGGVNTAINQVNTASSRLFNMIATCPDES